MLCDRQTRVHLDGIDAPRVMLDRVEAELNLSYFHVKPPTRRTRIRLMASASRWGVDRCVLGIVASLLFTASGIRHVPGVMEPALKFLKAVVDLAHNALDGSERRIAYSCGVENQDKSGQIACNQN